MFTHDKRALHLKLELWLAIFIMLLLSGCSGCGGCGGDLDGEGQITPPQRSCQAAAAFNDIGRGVSFNINLERASSDLAFSTDSCVSAQATAGSDFFYKATVPPNYKLRVGFFNYNGASGNVYIFTDCEDAAGTCLAGVESNPSDQPTQLIYINTTEATQTLIVGFDSSSGEGALEGAINIDEISCLPGERRCDEDGEAVERCTPEATYERYACDGACTDGRCDTPSGDSCTDAIKLEGDSGTITGDWISGTDQFTPKSDRAGQCMIRDRVNFSGRDDFYSVELKAGERLSASVTTPTRQAFLFLLEDCHDPETCVEYSSTVTAKTLQYYAKQDRTVYLVVDHEKRQAFNSYELSWDIKAGDSCIPSQTRCVDANTATYCNSTGTTERSYRCDQGCADGGCTITPAEHDSCATVAASAQDIGQGISISAELQDFTDDINEPLSCLGHTSAKGHDLFYKVNLAPDEIVEVHAQGSSNPLIYAFADCDEVNKTCVASALSDNPKAASLFYQNKTGAAQTRIIAIDSAYNTRGIVQAQINKQAPECEPRSSRCNQDTLLTCNAQRRYVPYECTGTCTNGHCDDAKGDVCLDAIALVGDNGIIETDWRDNTNNFSLRVGYTGQCYISYDPFTSKGAEDFYRVDLQAGELLSVDMKADHAMESLFFLESCVDAQACVQGTPNINTNELHYYAHQAISLYIVADQWDDGFDGNYKLSWSITRGGVCGPNQTRCIDAMTAGKCNADGSVETPINCANGCDFTGCSPDVATQDSCESVVASMASITGSLSTQAYMEDFSPTIALSPSEACPITIEEGSSDLFYKVELKADDRLRARATTTGNFTPIFYLFTDCGDASQTCLASNTKTTSLEYINTTGATQTLRLGVASLNTSGRGPVQVEIDISAKQCEPGAVQCHANGTSLLQCDHLGLFIPIACDGGCNEGACVKPTGDYCADAIPLVGASGKVSGALNAQNTNSYQLGAGYSGACYVDTSASINKSKETFYRVDLQASEELSVTLSSGNISGQLFLMTDCIDANSCVATGNTRGSTTLRYLAPSAQTVFIAVDNSSTTATQSYELDWSISSGAVCAAGTTTCIDPNTVSYCSQTGQISAAATCANGCFQGGCQAQAATQDVCADVLASATDVGDGLAIYALYEDFTNSVSFTTANSCAGGTPGRDLFYKVTLAADEVVRVSAQGYSSSNPIVYVIEDCSLNAASCLAGAREQGRSDSASVSYANTTGASKTVLVGIDSSRTSPSGPVKATIERLTPECMPGTAQCTINGAELLECSPQGLYERVWCDDGCVNGACITP